LDMNPVWPEYCQDLRIKFLGGLPQMDHLNAPLKYLNGYRVMVGERCRALIQNKVFNEDGIERFRMDLLWEQNPPNYDKDDSLSLAGNDIHSIKELPSRLIYFKNLLHLDLSNNRISSLSEISSTLDCCFRLLSLDLRDNKIDATLKDLLGVLSRCPGLKKLNVCRSTKDKKETEKPKEYAIMCFTTFLQLESVDDLPRTQYGLHVRQIKPVFSIFGNPDERRQSFSMEDQDQPGALSLSNGSDSPTNHSPPTPTPLGSMVEQYPDLVGFNIESYLPQDYNSSIGKSYDIAKLQELALQQGIEIEDNDEE